MRIAATQRGACYKERGCNNHRMNNVLVQNAWPLTPESITTGRIWVPQLLKCALTPQTSTLGHSRTYPPLNRYVYSIIHARRKRLERLLQRILYSHEQRAVQAQCLQ